jgi:hypothetical protein
VVSVALGAFVNELAIIPISTTPFVIAPASMDALFGHVRAEIPGVNRWGSGV